MTSKEALQDIEDWIEYFTRLDYVNPIVRGEVQDNFKKAYWETLPHLKLIKKDLEALEIFKKYLTIDIPDSPNFNGTYSIGLKEDENDDWDYTIIFVSKEEKDLLKEWLNNDK